MKLDKIVNSKIITLIAVVTCAFICFCHIQLFNTNGGNIPIFKLFTKKRATSHSMLKKKILDPYFLILTERLGGAEIFIHPDLNVYQKFIEGLQWRLSIDSMADYNYVISNQQMIRLRKNKFLTQNFNRDSTTNGIRGGLILFLPDGNHPYSYSSKYVIMLFNQYLVLVPYELFQLIT